MTEDKSNIRNFWDYRSLTFDRSPGHTLNSREEETAWKSLFSENLGTCTDILDVGSGTGFLSLMLAEMGYHVTGVDLSEKMIACAWEKARCKGCIIDFHQGDAENLPFPDNSFDAVVNRAVLWTLPHPDVAVREWLRVLRPGGRLCFFLHEPQDTTGTGIHRTLVSIWTMITEMRNPWYTLDSRRAGISLPFKGGVRPEIVTDLLHTAGYEDIRAARIEEIDGLRQKNLPAIYRLNRTHGQYLYTARKSEDRHA